MSTSKSVSLDAFLGLLVIAVPVTVFLLTRDGENPFVDGMTAFVALLISMFLLSVIWLNRSAKIPMLGIFVLIYLVFWHLRFATLAMFPAGELVLSRTVLVDHEIFNSYSWIVFLSVVSAVAGIIFAHLLVQPNLIKSSTRRSAEMADLAGTIRRNVYGIFAYCLLAFAFQVYSTQVSAESLPTWLGYLSLFFPFSLIMLLTMLVLLNRDIYGKYKFLIVVYILTYVALTVFAGSRSIMLNFVLGGLFLFAIFNIRIKVRISHFIVLLLVGATIIISFAYGTFQRHMRSENGYNANSESTQYVLERMTNMDAWETIVGMAFARAGSLDYSAEMYANPEYAEVVSIENLLKGAIDSYIPGAVFEDSRLVELRLRDIYNPTAEGYQSDAIGAVGENFLLFGNAFPLAIALVAFVFTYIYYSVGEGIFGTYVKFSLAIGLMSWWNSFGYDWLLVDSGRQLLFGLLVIALIFRRRNDVSRQFGVEKGLG